MAVKKTAAEQNAENAVSASLHRASPAFLFTSARPFWATSRKTRFTPALLRRP